MSLVQCDELLLAYPRDNAVYSPGDSNDCRHVATVKTTEPVYAIRGSQFESAP